MSNHKEIVLDIWKSHKNYLGGGNSGSLDFPNLSNLLAHCFCPGPFFYYVIDSPSLTFDRVSESILNVLGIEAKNATIQDVIDRLHPEDMEFFLRCEDMVAFFLKNCIAPEKVVKYKICYCWRLRTRDGSYRLFLLQTLTLKTTPDGALLKVFGAHADISHITSTNNYKLSLIGLDGEPSYTDIDVFGKPAFENFRPYQFSLAGNEFSRREMEVLRLLGDGHSTTEISQQLNISSQTVATHRKNMIRKAGAKNSVDLVVTCIKKGYL
ncbi:LuxR C-terminal-related transcriptional regulator [Pseudohongiella sp.]|uniref:HTH luxR-type domain-containing protein n=1 Tax=marine sediment metagenome TaxID=412755 RepID=A0A0F9W3K5_9ZZZZ|nr:LuxR C-terminal-related transcriptional regulator [Pseudohongiella sp.]HDZ09994.1 LuxR family transcriptional regulator [Pseudohongiella sp.]